MSSISRIEAKVSGFVSLAERVVRGPADGRLGASEAAALVRRMQRSPAWRDRARDAFGTLPTSGAELRRFIDAPPQLEARRRLAAAQARLAPQTNERTLAARREASLLLASTLAQAKRSVQGSVRQRALVDRYLASLADVSDPQMRAFYAGALEVSGMRLDPAQRVLRENILKRVLVPSMPIDAYTENRTRPLVVRMRAHHEFFKEDLRFFSADRGFRQVRASADGKRFEFRATLPDPTGVKRPLEVRVFLEEGELDVLDRMGDRDAHIFVYSGHSALGGNLSQWLQESPSMTGVPKTVLAMCCRGKDFIAEFNAKHPKALLITSKAPTYSTAMPVMLQGLFDTAARGADFAFMRSTTGPKLPDEPADNYTYPDQLERLLAGDYDCDGKRDFGPKGHDAFFDVDRRAKGVAFMRALNFANTVLHYQHDHALEQKQKPHPVGRWGDRLIADGPIGEPRDGEQVRLVPSEGKDARGRPATFMRVQFNAELTKKNPNVMAGIVTAEVALELARRELGEVSEKERLRAVLLGAQAVYYLDVYADSQPTTMAAFFEHFGLSGLTDRDVEKLMNKFDAHANNPQTDAFVKLVQARQAKALVA